jgi:hypothetical protein
MVTPSVGKKSSNVSLRADTTNPAPVKPVAGVITVGSNPLGYQENRFSQVVDPSKRTADFISGWTASHIAPHTDLHSAAHTTLNPTPEQKTNLQAVTNHVLGLNDSSLASRTVGSTQPPVGAPVGSASATIPTAVQTAINNLQANTQASQSAGNPLGALLAKVLGGAGVGGGGSTAPGVAPQTNDAMAQYSAALANYKANNINTPAGMPQGQQVTPVYNDPALSMWQSQVNAYNQGKVNNSYSAAVAPGSPPGAPIGAMNPSGGITPNPNPGVGTGWTPYMPRY